MKSKPVVIALWSIYFGLLGFELYQIIAPYEGKPYRRYAAIVAWIGFGFYLLKRRKKQPQSTSAEQDDAK